jgi:hypothetical protein
MGSLLKNLTRTLALIGRRFVLKKVTDRYGVYFAQELSANVSQATKIIKPCFFELMVLFHDKLNLTFSLPLQ